MKRTGPAANQGAFVLLATACAASIVLAVLAWVAGRSYRTTVEQSLDRYAAIATWQLADVTREALSEALERTLWPVRQFGVVSADGFPPVTAFARFVPDDIECPCPLPLSARFYVRFDLQEGRMDTSGEAFDPETRRSLAETLVRVARDGAGDGALLSWSDRGDTLFLAALALPDRTGRVAAVYGAAVPPSAIAPVLFRALDEATLLPPSVVAEGAVDETFLVRVSGAGGRALFSAGSGTPSTHGAAAELGTDLAGFSVELTLTDAAVTLLTPGAGTPPWALAGLLIGALALFWAAFRSLAAERRVLRAQRRLVTALSHDLRTPLTQIRLHAETLRLGRARSDAERNSYLDFIDQEARRLGHTIENALTVGRAADGLPPPEPLDIAAVVRDEVEHQQRLAPGTDLRVHGPCRLRAMARETPLRRVLANLLDNAVKYGPADAPVDVELGSCATNVHVRVIDRGPGIQPSERHRVFEPFVRLGQARPETAGSGIGLTVVRDLVTAMGGTVRIEPAEPRGTAFVVELALAPDPSTSNAEAPDP